MGRFLRVALKHSGHHEEVNLTAPAFPGMRVDLEGGVTFDQGQKGTVRILEEDALQGKTVAGAYAAGDIGFLKEPKSGDVFAIRVKSGQALVVGDKLCVDTDGLYIKSPGGVDLEEFEAMEAYTTVADELVKAKFI